MKSIVHNYFINVGLQAAYSLASFIVTSIIVSKLHSGANTDEVLICSQVLGLILMIMSEVSLVSQSKTSTFYTSILRFRVVTPSFLIYSIAIIVYLAFILIRRDAIRFDGYTALLFLVFIYINLYLCYEITKNINREIINNSFTNVNLIFLAGGIIQITIFLSLSYISIQSYFLVITVANFMQYLITRYFFDYSTHPSRRLQLDIKYKNIFWFIKSPLLISFHTQILLIFSSSFLGFFDNGLISVFVMLFVGVLSISSLLTKQLGYFMQFNHINLKEHWNGFFKSVFLVYCGVFLLIFYLTNCFNVDSLIVNLKNRALAKLINDNFFTLIKMLYLFPPIITAQIIFRYSLKNSLGGVLLLVNTALLGSIFFVVRSFTAMEYETLENYIIIFITLHSMLIFYIFVRFYKCADQI